MDNFRKAKLLQKLRFGKSSRSDEGVIDKMVNKTALGDSSFFAASRFLRALLGVGLCLAMYASMASIVPAQEKEKVQAKDTKAEKKDNDGRDEKEEEKELPKIEVFTGFSHLRSDGNGLNGWNVVVIGNVNSWFGVAADVSGHYRSENTLLGKLKESEHSVTFGPHFALRKSKLVPFAYTLFGVAWERTSLGEESETGSGFASELGGGLDYEINEKVAIRLIDVAASITHNDGETKTKPKLAFGVVFHFGHKK